MIIYNPLSTFEIAVIGGIGVTIGQASDSYIGLKRLEQVEEPQVFPLEVEQFIHIYVLDIGTYIHYLFWSSFFELVWYNSDEYS